MTENIHPSPLHAYIFTRFREAFGDPNTSLQKDDHWAFAGAIPDKAINVLVNGTPAFPAVWLFDPHEISDPVYSSAVSTEMQVDKIITLIQARITRAGKPRESKPI